MRKIVLSLAMVWVALLMGCSDPAVKPAANMPSGEAQVQAAELPHIDYGVMDLANSYASLEELTADSKLIVEADLTHDVSQLNYKGANFAITEVLIKDVIKGESSLNNQTVSILELEQFNLQATRQSDRHVLFLDKYIGPVTEDAYVITGVYQGKFSINAQGLIHYDALDYNGLVTFQNKLEQLDVRSLKKAVHKAEKAVQTKGDEAFR